MKRTTLALAMLLVGATAFATEKDNEKSTTAKKDVAIISHTPSKFKLVYLDKTEGMVQVSLKNDKGVTIYNSIIENNDGFAQPYDLEKLPEGTYTFAVTKPDGSTVEQSVNYEKNPVVEPNFSANVLNVNDGKKFRLAVVSKSQEAGKTSVEVYDEDNNLIHSESIKSDGGFRKTFDLSAVNSDSFKFAISNASGTKSLTAE